MEDMLIHLAKLRADAEEAARVGNQSSDPAKRDLFTKIAQHLTVLAGEVQRAIDRQSSSEKRGGAVETNATDIDNA